MNRSTRAAAFVLVSLLAALIGGFVLYLLYSGPRESAVALLAGCALVAFAFAVLDSKLSWNVAGYRKFTAVAGIDDRTQNAIGATIEYLFYDQDGRKLLPKPVEVSLGRAQKISIDLRNVVSLRVTCAGRDAKTGERRPTRTAFGDPVVVQ